MKYIYVLILGGFLFASCNQSVVYKEKKEVPKGIWEIKSPLEFRFSAEDTVGDYNVFFTFDLKENFKTSNLWIFARTQAPGGNILHDTLMFQITDYAGNWYGKKSGEIIAHKFVYKANIRFPRKGNYLFSLEHGMRPHQLPEIKTAGISIEKCPPAENP